MDGDIGYHPLGCGLVKEVWRLVPLCLRWCLWREKNARHFEDVGATKAFA